MRVGAAVGGARKASAAGVECQMAVGGEVGWPAMWASDGPPPAVLLPVGHAAGGFSSPPHSPRPRPGPTLHCTATGTPTPPHRVPAVACEPHAPVNGGLVEASPPAATGVSAVGQPERVPHGPKPPRPPLHPRSSAAMHVGGRGCVPEEAAAAASARGRSPSRRVCGHHGDSQVGGGGSRPTASTLGAGAWVGGGAGGNDSVKPDTLPSDTAGVRPTPPKWSAEAVGGTQATVANRRHREIAYCPRRGVPRPFLERCRGRAAFALRGARLTETELVQFEDHLSGDSNTDC